MKIAILLIGLTLGDEVKVKVRKNNPNLCRCGEMRTKDAPDITIIEPDDEEEKITTEAPNNVVAYEDKSVLKLFSDGQTKLEKAGAVMDMKDFEPYQPQERPWLMVIRLQKEDEVDFVECTGSLISMNFVLTSKSCICWDEFGCNVTKRAEKIDDNNSYVVPALFYKVAKSVKVVEASMFQEYSRVGFVIDPHKGRAKNDILMMNLRNPFNFSSLIMPICLPQEDFDEDENLEAYILGFNFYLHNKVPDTDKCVTVGGPRQEKCKHFVRKDDDTVIKGCSFLGTYRAPECIELMKFMNWTHLLPDDLDRVTVEFNVSQIPEDQRKSRFAGFKKELASIDCFDETPGQYGWCGTCQSEAKKGERGYCGPDQAVEGDDLYEAELSRPSEFGGWGFCDKLCQTSQNPGFRGEPVLLETMRLVKDHDECKSPLGSKNYNDFWRMCLQAQQILHKKLTYRKLAANKFEEVQDPHPDREKVIVPPRILTSIGDAGAPIFKIIKKKEGRANAVLIGIMGTNQYQPRVAQNLFAQDSFKHRNMSEIITRIKPMMKFIKKTLNQYDSTEKCAN